MTQDFYSNGKLLLSGEYGILDGAEGWAFPTKFGQRLKVASNTSGLLTWTGIDADGSVWFQGTYGLRNFTELSTTDGKVSISLIEILTQTRKLNPRFLEHSEGCAVETVLTFPRNWGLGSSSTLLNNMAQWAQVNPYLLLSRTFGGSGYDIACALHNHPLLFKIENKKPIVRKVKSKLPFSNKLYFVYLNQKKNSREAITAYREQPINKIALTTTLTELTGALVKARTLKEFEKVLDQHEKTLSLALSVPTIKEQLFPDYTGSIKSLGGWGGDFILVTERDITLEYFIQKGYPTIIPFSEMIL